MKKNQTNNIEWRVSLLEKNYEELSKDLKLVIENHLPHLREELASIRTELRTSSIINVGAIILGLLISRLIQ